MQALEIIIGAVIIALSVIIIVLVAAQESKQSNLSAIQGSAGSGFKGRGREKDGLLKKATKIMAAVFFVVVLAAAIFTNLKK